MIRQKWFVNICIFLGFCQCRINYIGKSDDIKIIPI